MTHKSLGKQVLSLALSCAALVVLSGCRHEETVAIATADQVVAAEEAEQSLVSSEDVSTVETAPLVSKESVTPVPYRSPVVTPPRPTAPSSPRPVSPKPVYAQYPPPIATVSPPPPPKPVLVTVPVGTVLRVEIEDHLSSHTSQVGQQFYATITQDIAAEGRVAIRRGSTVIGRVTEADPAKKIGGRAHLSLEFETLDLGSGQRRPMSAQFAQAGKSQTTKDAAIIGGSTIGGAIIGEAIEDGEGGVVGAILGGLGGAYAAKKTKAKPVEVPAGTRVDLELTQPITLEIYPGS
jgi:hypothetical protein